MKRLIFLTGHFPQQKRRTSMLWVTDHLQAKGWHVTYVTVGYSWLSWVGNDKRLATLDKVPQRGTHVISPSLTGVYGLSPWHPVRSQFQSLNLFLEPFCNLFTAYWAPRLRKLLPSADLVICESGAPVLLGQLVAKYAPQATRIYRVSDDIRLLNAPDVMLRAEATHHHFDRISTGSPLIAQRFQDHPNVTLDPMGVPYDQINISTADPYTRTPEGKIAVCAGSTLLDMQAILRTARRCPHWQIHVIGRLKTKPPVLPNVTWHGEQPFAKTLSYIQHADIGLAPFQDVPGVEYQITNSNRILLYRYCGLPILAPARLCTPDIPSLISDSAQDAPARCEAFGRQPEPIPDWSALADALVQNGVTEPPELTSIAPETTTKPLVNTLPPLASSA